MAKSLLRGKFDLTVVGGGIVGLATARQVLLKHPKLRVCVLEKESSLATHQSKRNSGVVHAGIYYKRGSLKSKFCIRGARLIEDYCQARNLAYKKCGKLIVAIKPREQETLHNLFRNAQANRIEGIELITSDRIKEIQPTCVNALEAIWSPNTAIVDWQQVALSYAKDFEQLGGKIFTDFRICLLDSQGDGRKKTIVLKNDKQERDADVIETRSMVNCAGLFSDLLARQTGNDEHPKVVPFKGNYFMLSDKHASLVKTNIYPVPNPDLPFLGVHVTPRVDGSVLIGPTSLLTLGYERYDPDNQPPRLIELYHILYRSGLLKLIRKRGNIKAGLQELWRYFSKERIVMDIQNFLPDLEASDLIDNKFCGIRAQAVTRRGQLVDDFLFETGVRPQYDKVLHVRNCPSPAATSSLAIAERVVSILEERFI